MDIKIRTYEVAGVAVTKAGKICVRYCGEVKDIPIREKLAAKNGETVAFEVLPKRMNKIDACNYLISVAAMVAKRLSKSSKEVGDAIKVELAKKEIVAGIAVKVPAKRGRKPAVKATEKAPVKAKNKSVRKGKKESVKAEPVPVAQVDEDMVEDVDADITNLQIEELESDDFDLSEFERLAVEQD